MAMIAILIAAALQAAAATPASEEIVVTAARKDCRASWRGKALSRAELDRQAANWTSGIPVRVIAPDWADYRCLTKIVLRLHDRGVTQVEFVDPPQR